MQELQVFQNEKFGEIRIEIVNGKEFFCANDIAKSLGYSNHSKAISDHCKGVTKCYIPTNGGYMTFLFKKNKIGGITNARIN